MNFIENDEEEEENTPMRIIENDEEEEENFDEDIFGISSNSVESPTSESQNLSTYEIGRLDQNRFFNHINSNVNSHTIRDDSFNKFCIFCNHLNKELLPMGSLNEFGKYIYNEVFKVTIFRWENINIEWEDWMSKKNIIKKFNIYLMHVKQMEPYVQGTVFANFVDDCRNLVRTLKKSEAVKMAKQKYDYYFNLLLKQSEEDKEKKENEFFTFPAWDETQFIDFFYRMDDQYSKKHLSVEKKIKKNNYAHAIKIQDKVPTLINMLDFKSVGTAVGAVEKLLKTNSKIIDS